MNSYGDSQTPRARASVPGSNGGSAPGDDPSRYSGSARPDAYRRGTGGRASVPGSGSGTGAVGGRASVGSASVGSASVGSASVGSARVGARASVGAAPVGAAAPAGRASVRPTPGFGGVGTGGPDEDTPARGKDKSKAAKRRRRTNILTAAAAVLVIMLGAGVVGGTYFFDSVELPPPTTEDQSNVILDSKGTVLAKLGEQNRTVVPEEKINKYVKDAVVAAEDKNFYNHHGIDMKGIVRAAWNNFTGGATQGASTITQQYARHVADLKDISINRKLREAVIARKLESQYKKNQILGMYLNYIYLGEGRYGIEAAAQGYFGKSVLTPVGDPKAITPYEAAVLASIIKQPEKSATHPGYDPNYGPVEAKERWGYTLTNMLEMNAISQEQFDQRKYPAVRKPGASSTKNALNKPVGMIMRHVRAELASMGISQQEFDKGGLTVTTTIDPGVQKAAEEAGSRQSKESRMAKKPKSYQAAVIGIDPGTGRVLGYYGGDDPNGIDYGGYMSGDGTKITGGQSPGSTMKIYTLAAALQEDISFDTVWDGTKKRANGKKINNAGAEDSGLCQGKPTYCDLEYATVKSYNFPFYWIADGIGREKVIEAAKNAGLKHMFTDGNKQFPNGKLVDLTKTDKSTWLKEGYFDNEVAFGQYRVVPLEHAEGVATIVNGGTHHNAHFIKSVKQVDADTGKTVIRGREKLDGNRVFPADQMSNLQGVMKKIVEVDDRDLRNGREAIAKSGTWEFNDGKDSRNGSGDCWFVGGIPQLAATVWVGGAGNKVELKDGGKDMFGAGTPSLIWRDFLNAATKAMDIKKEPFPTRIKTGNDNSPYANGKRPPEPTTPDPNDCLFGVVGNCGPNNGGQNNGGNNNGGQNNGGNNNGGNGNGNGTPGLPGGGNGNGGGQVTPTFPNNEQGTENNDDGD